MIVYNIKIEFSVYDEQIPQQTPQEILNQIIITTGNFITLGLTEKLEINLVPEHQDSPCAYRVSDSLRSIANSLHSLSEKAEEERE